MAERLERPGARRHQQHAHRRHQRGQARRPREGRAERQRYGRHPADHDQQRGHPLELPRVLAQDDQLGDDAGRDRQRSYDARRHAALHDHRDPRTGQSGRERRQLRHVVGVEDPGRLAERHGDRQERAADRDDPAGPRIVAPHARQHRHADAGHQREAEQPAGLAAKAVVEQAQHAGVAAEGSAAAATPAGAAASGRALLPGQPAEAVVAEDQRPDAVVRRARDPGPVGGRSQPDQHRPGQPDDGHRRAAETELAKCGKSPARSDPQPRRGQSRHDQQGRAHLRLEPEADGHARPHDPARAPVLERSHHEPERGRDAQHEQRVGVVVPRDRDGHRRQREHEPGAEAGGAAEAPARQVIDQRDAAHAHQRLRHQHAPGAEAERPHRQGLDPECERRLVDGHDTTAVERPEQERVPALAHRANGRAVVLVREAVAAERPEVEHPGQHQQGGQLGPRPAERTRPEARAPGYRAG